MLLTKSLYKLARNMPAHQHHQPLRNTSPVPKRDGRPAAGRRELLTLEPLGTRQMATAVASLDATLGRSPRAPPAPLDDSPAVLVARRRPAPPAPPGPAPAASFLRTNRTRRVHPILIGHAASIPY
jgi:hypothetical protein